MKRKILLPHLLIVVFFGVTSLFIINACKKDDTVNTKKVPKQIEEYITASVGGKLTTSDSINLAIPPNALTTDGKVFVGRTGTEPTSVPNTNLQVVGNP